MRFDVTSNGYTKHDIPAEEFASLVNTAEFHVIKKLPIGGTFERKRKPTSDARHYEFKAVRVS